MKINVRLDDDTQDRIKNDITQNFENNCKILSFFNERNTEIVLNNYATAIIIIKLTIGKPTVDKWKRNMENTTVVNALGIFNQLKIFSNYVEQFILKGTRAEKPPVIKLEDEDKSEFLAKGYDDLEPEVIENLHNLTTLIHRMKNDFEGISQDLVLLCNTTCFEKSDLQSIKKRLKIEEIVPIQDKELVLLIKPQMLTPPIRFYKNPFEVHFDCGGGTINYNYVVFLYWRGALKIRDEKAIQCRKIDLSNYNFE